MGLCKFSITDFLALPHRIDGRYREWNCHQRARKWNDKMSLTFADYNANYSFLAAFMSCLGCAFHGFNSERVSHSITDHSHPNPWTQWFVFMDWWSSLFCSCHAFVGWYAIQDKILPLYILALWCDGCAVERMCNQGQRDCWEILNVHPCSTLNDDEKDNVRRHHKFYTDLDDVDSSRCAPG